MGYVHCCAGLRKAQTFAIQPEQNYLYAQIDYLEKCPICGHTVIQLTRMDKRNQISICRKTNEKARKLFSKIQDLIIFEKDKHFNTTKSKSRFYLYYNEYGKKKKCYSNLSSMKLGLLENR